MYAHYDKPVEELFANSPLVTTTCPLVNPSQQGWNPQRIATKYFGAFKSHIREPIIWMLCWGWTSQNCRISLLLESFLVYPLFALLTWACWILFQYCNDWSTTVRVCCMASEMLGSQGWNTLLSWAGLGRRSLLDGRGWKKVGVTGWQQRDLTKGCNIYKGHCNLEYINARLDQTHRRIAHTVFRAFAHDLQFFAHAANADSSNIQSACRLGTAVQVQI